MVAVPVDVFDNVTEFFPGTEIVFVLTTEMAVKARL